MTSFIRHWENLTRNPSFRLLKLEIQDKSVWVQVADNHLSNIVKEIIIDGEETSFGVPNVLIVVESQEGGYDVYQYEGKLLLERVEKDGKEDIKIGNAAEISTIVKLEIFGK